MRQRHNLLLLDEPTNHLDLDSREALEESLEDFPGSIVFVSHDRAFIDRLATRVLDLRGGRALALPGNYSETAEARADRRRRPEPEVFPGRSEIATPPASPPRPAKRAESGAEKESARRRKKIKTLEDRIAAFEREIEALETRLWEEALTLGSLEANRLAREKSEKKGELDQLIEEWARLSEEEAERVGSRAT